MKISTISVGYKVTGTANAIEFVDYIHNREKCWIPAKGNKDVTFPIQVHLHPEFYPRIL